MSDIQPNSAETLRKRAEALLNRSPESFKPADLQNVNTLAHELAVHQAELELQNEELRNTQVALQETRDRFAQLFEHAPVGYVVLDAAGVIRQTNATWGHLLGCPDEDFRGKAFADTLLEEDAPLFLSRFRAFFRNPASKQIVARIKRRSAPPFHARIEARPHTASPRRRAGVTPDSELMVVVSDISDLQEARSELEVRHAQLTAANQRLDHIYRVLLGIRNVNQLIVAEDDPRRLIEKACINLTETMGYHNAWIALLGGESARGLGLPHGEPVAAVAAAGFDGGFAALRERLERGDFPDCMKHVLDKGDTLVVGDPDTQCDDCPVHREYHGRAGLVRRLKFGDVIYGIMAASVPASYAHDAEEQDLFNEVAGDLAFALHKIEAAERLWASQHDLKRAQALAHVGSWRFDLNTGNVIASEETRRIYGVGDGEISISQVQTIPLPQYREKLDLALKALIEDKAPYDVEFDIRRPSDGAIRSIHSLAEYDAARHMIVGAIHDISERRQREADIELLGQMLDDAPAAITIHDTDGNFLFSNRQNIILHGYESRSAFLNINLRQLDVPESAALLAERIRKIAEHGEARFEVAHYRKDGSTFPLEILAKRIDWRGRPALLSIATDITERKRAEEALRRSEQQKKLILNATAELVAYFDLDLRILWANRTAAESVGLAAEELVGRYCFELWHGRNQPCDDCPIVQARQEMRPVQGEMQTPDGRHWSLRGYPVFDDQNQLTALVEFGQDISPQKKADIDRETLQHQLHQAQKMESVGRLAGGVAHDFNNMLNVILGRAEMIFDGLPGDSPMRHDLDEIRKAAERSVNLTRQLLAFARKQTIAPRELDLNDAVASMLRMLQRLIGEDIDLVWKPGANTPSVRIDPGQLDQVLANLAVNARDAIGPRNGKITIETNHALIDQEYCSHHAGFVPGHYVMLAISDDGCGMDQHTLANIFEPFFTTKAVGQGTGLGLATVYGIVKQNNGFINVYSEPDNGTTFRIYLPALDVESTPSVDAASHSDTPLARGHETILVVEDQPALLALAREMLDRLGYEVLTAGSPNEALHLARNFTGKIDLLITDVVMPEMDGRSLADNLLRLCPDLKSLFMSGYTANVIAHKCVLDEGVAFIQKPFSLKDLSHKVREVLQACSQ